MGTRGMVATLSSILLIPALATAAPLGRAFTYQGELSQSGAPVDGTVHLRFSLWDAPGAGDPPTGGTQIGASQVVANVAIAEGLFTALVNAGEEFGADAFDGEARWLQIEVCTDASCASTTVLGPRQALTAGPYSLGPWQTSGSDLSYGKGNVGIGTTTPVTPLHIRTNLEGIRLQGTSGSAYMGFSDDAGNLIGYVGDASANDHDTYLGSQSNNVNLYAGGFVMTAQSNGRVGIGTYSPADRLEVRGNIRLGSFGEYFAPAGAENLRILRGKISSTGGILFGSGFTASRSTTGVYFINFSPTYPSGQYPIVTASAESNGAARFAMINFPTHIACSVRIVNGSGTAVDDDFYFIAVGPR